jgi:lysozyme
VVTRRRTAGVVAVGVAAVLAAVVWYGWFPQYRPGLADGEVYGVDVSRHQGRIDWRKVSDDGIDVAYVKATEGGDHVDEEFRRNWRGAGEAGLLRGAYHFFTLCRAGDVQAKHFVSVVGDEDPLLPPAVDLELAGNCRDRPPLLTLRREVRSYLDVVDRACRCTTVVYVGQDFLDRYPMDFGEHPRWIRRILRHPSESEWMLWQFTGAAHVSGIDGAADLNVVRATRQDVAP